MTGSILFVGDIHDKGSIVCPAVEHHMTERHVDTVVLLGDLLNDWNMSAKGEINEFAILHDHVLAWRHDGVDVRVLLGNHDVIYTTQPRSIEAYRLKDCSPGYNPGAHGTIRPMLLELEPQIAYGVRLADDPNGRQVLCTHAGVTLSWMDWCRRILGSEPLGDGAAYIALWLNQLFRDHPVTFMERIGLKRGGGWNKTISPLWVDRGEHNEHDSVLPGDIIQIVGHTPVPTITPAPGIRYCDTMSDDSHGNHLGDGSMLLYDGTTGRFDILPWPEHIERNA